MAEKKKSNYRKSQKESRNSLEEKSYYPSSTKGSLTPDQIDLVKVKHYASLGLYNYHIAYALGVPTRTFDKWLSEWEDLGKAVYKGRAESLCTVMNVIYEKAVIDKDLKAAIFFAKANGIKDNIDPLINVNVETESLNVINNINEMDNIDNMTYSDAKDLYVDMMRAS